MKIIVQKYGGSSLKDLEAMEKVCNKIARKLKTDTKLVVVVSAQGKTTNELISKAQEYSNNRLDKYALDFLLSTGEMQSAALLALMLNSKGIRSTCITGMQAGILTNSEYGEAKIIDIFEDNILKRLEDLDVVIVTGFQGVDLFGNITTLGRGGSDLSAVALAAALKAKACEIYSDTNGVFSADPRIIQKAKKLDNVSYDEMLEASSNGAKVLHNRAVSMAQKYGVVIQCKNTYSNSKGTKILEEKEKTREKEKINETQNIPIISSKDNLTKISVIGKMLFSNVDIIHSIYDLSKELNTHIQMISTSETCISFIVDTEKAKEFMIKLHEKIC